MSLRYTIVVDSRIGQVEGFIEPSHPNVGQFLGIPYAEPPMGSLRWRPPVPKPTQDYIKAVAFGPSCWQNWSSAPSIYNRDVLEFSITGPESEDCLTLNIWAPSKSLKTGSRKLLPVIVWIHGGAFRINGGEIPYQNPAPWVERSQKHIVVGINYRLNVFGFPNAAGLTPNEQNLGFLDIRLGLEWVRDNIASFGGDSSRITAWGHSTGAIGLDYYNFSTIDDPIVTGFIFNSGTALAPIRKGSHEHFSFIAKHFGFPGGDAEAELNYMRRIDAKDLISFINRHQDEKSEPSISFMAMVDGVSRVDDYQEKMLKGMFTKLPAIISTTQEEGNSMAIWHEQGVELNESTDITQNWFLKAANGSCRLRHAANAISFRFLYAGNFPNISPRPWHGAYHSAELPMIFGTSDIVRGPSTELELETSHTMQDLYVAFAESSTDGLIALGWEPYRPAGTAIKFGADGLAKQYIPVDSLEEYHS